MTRVPTHVLSASLSVPIVHNPRRRRMTLTGWCCSTLPAPEAGPRCGSRAVAPRGQVFCPHCWAPFLVPSRLFWPEAEARA